MQERTPKSRSSSTSSPTTYTLWAAPTSSARGSTSCGPRRVLTEACESGMLRSAEAEGLRFELLWRDYFALVTHKFALRQMREAGVPEAASSF